MKKTMFGFGAWRFLLAFLVAISHLWKHMIDGPAAYAVWGFFVLSGYLMTFILREKYGFSAAGLKAYAHNRILRIMPGYWLATAFGVVTLLVLSAKGIDAGRLNGAFALPSDWRHWLFPISLVPFLPHDGLPMPVSVALSVELAAYCLMPFSAASRSAAWLGLIISALLNLKLGLNIPNFMERYQGFLTSFMAFSAGSLICHYRRQLAWAVDPRKSLFAWGLQCLIWLRYDPWPWTYGLYASIAISAWVTLSLAEMQPGKLDGWLGDMSYPVYLFHSAVAAWFLGLFGYDRPFKFFAAAFIATLIISWLIVRFVERPLQAKKKTGKDRPKTFWLHEAGSCIDG